MTLQEFQSEIEDMYIWAMGGCRDSSCIIERTMAGMHTNRGCRCQPHLFSDRLLAIAVKLDTYPKHETWNQDEQ